MQIGGPTVEQKVSLLDDLPFVEKQDVTAEDSATPTYTIEITDRPTV